VSFDAPDPVKSAAVTNALVDQILRQNVELRTGASGGTLDFFQQEVERLSTELAQQNARILEFEQANRHLVQIKITSITESCAPVTLIFEPL
jgi:uncharacterized protein involved in exopolysaccharide biosynthesis